MEELKTYALAHYEEGGHWVYETFGKEEYAHEIAAAHGDIEAAKVRLREYWELVEEQCQNTRFE